MPARHRGWWNVTFSTVEEDCGSICFLGPYFIQSVSAIHLIPYTQWVPIEWKIGESVVNKTWSLSEGRGRHLRGMVTPWQRAHRNSKDAWGKRGSSYVGATKCFIQKSTRQWRAKGTEHIDVTRAKGGDLPGLVLLPPIWEWWGLGWGFMSMSQTQKQWQKSGSVLRPKTPKV